MKFSEVLKTTITMAKAVKRSRFNRKGNEDLPMISTGTGSAVESATAEETRLHDFLERLPETQVYLLAAITDLGRGDFDTKAEFLDYVIDVPDIFGDAKSVVEYLMNRMPLPDFLEDGLKRLSELKINVDKLP